MVPDFQPKGMGYIGKPPSGWTIHTAEHVCTKITDGTHDTPKPVESGFPYITAIHVKNGEIDFGNSLFLTEEDHRPIYNRCFPEKGDLLVVNIGAGVGECGFVDSSFEFSMKNVAILKPRREVLRPEFLLQLHLSRKDRIAHSVKSGGAQPFLALGTLRKLKMLLPPLIEQIEISKVLATWDKAIEVTEKLIANSERQKKALMQQLLTGKKRLKGFSEDWKKQKFGEIAAFDTGYAFKSKDFSPEGEARIIRMSDLKEGRLKTSDFCLLPISKIKGLERFRITNGDFLFGMSGSLGNYAWVKTDDQLLYLNQRVGRMRSRDGFNPIFAQYLYLSNKVQSRILSLAEGAAQLNISLRELRNISVEVPSESEQIEIIQIIESESEFLKLNQQNLARLKKEKSALMQQLLTGKRRVKIDKEIAA